LKKKLSIISGGGGSRKKRVPRIINGSDVGRGGGPNLGVRQQFRVGGGTGKEEDDDHFLYVGTDP